MTPDRFAAASSSVAINIRRLVIGFIATSLLAATPALAQERVNLSRSLTDFVARSQSGTKPVIVEGPQAEIDRLASDYGLTIQKRLPSGAVFTANAGQIERLGRVPSRIGVFQAAVPVAAQKGEGRDQSAGADAGDHGEARPAPSLGQPHQGPSAESSPCRAS